MMTRLFACLLLLVGIIHTASAQSTPSDEVIFINGDVLQGKVTEVNVFEIKMIRSDIPEGPLFVFPRQEVFMIRYSNGVKDVISRFPSVPNNNTMAVQPLRPGQTGYKSPGLAFLFSALIPGAGQFYVGDNKRGGVMIGLWSLGWITAGISAGVAPRYDPYCYYDANGNYYCDPGYRSFPGPGFGLGIALSTGMWLWSVIDAPVRAANYNRNSAMAKWLEYQPSEQTVLRIHPFRSPGLGGSLTFDF